MNGGPSDEFYDAKVKVLQEEIEHHVEEEERRMEGLFAQARKAGLDMDSLGEQLAARKSELTERVQDQRSSNPEADVNGRRVGLKGPLRPSIQRQRWRGRISSRLP